MILRPPKKNPRPVQFENKPPPFVSRPRRPPSRSKFFFQGEKRVSFLQNDALIAILIVEGREVVFRKARDELYHVVGSEKTRIRKYIHKKKQVFGAFSLCFTPNPETRVDRFALRSNPVAGLPRKCNLPARFCSKCGFFLVCRGH